MNPVSIAISFIVTIFGVAFPILFQVATRLDEKYSSILILQLFNKEKERSFFLIALITSLVSIFIYIIEIPPLIQAPSFSYIINNSAIIILVLSTTTLVFSFFFFVKKILIYNTPTRFLQYLIHKHEKEPNNNKYFEAIGDLIHNSIKEQNITVTKTIANFLSYSFQNERENNNEKPVEYPYAFYRIIYNSIEEFANLKSKKLNNIERQFTGMYGFFGDFKNPEISNITYTCIWKSLLLILKYNNDDMMLNYWEYAHTYITNQLREISPKFTDFSNKIENQEEINRRNKQREKFFELHYALGGLLLYKEKYNCIKRILNFTTSIPPSYDLLPKSMDEIFQRYMEFQDPYEKKYTWISSIYPFPETEGLKADYEIKKWITSYLTLLFLRHYTNNQSSQPKYIPKTQNEKRVWLENIETLKHKTKQIINNKNLLKATNIIIESQQNLKINEFIDSYIKRLEREFEKIAIEQPISKYKEKQFEETSKEIISKTINSLHPILNSFPISKDFTNWFVNGQKVVVDKSAFVEDQEADHANFDSFLAQHVALKIQKSISETFFHSKSKTYLIEEKNVFPAIKKLNLSQDFIILNFGQNIEWFKQTFLVDGLEKSSYNNIKIINFEHSSFNLVGQSFFILRKSDLPQIYHREINKDEINKFELKEIDKKIELYGSIINLQKNEEIQKELKTTYPDKELSKSALLSLVLKLEIRWKNEINCVMIKTHSKYTDKGVPDKLEDIKKIE
ncbi:hypothetical protein [Anaerophaga thermohalophila]|uniref:hypothetical protein n=1 Tax=Anaerophaga thermohalophila TaxID=177400 RepID=UPI000317FD71|nr:hypothetical protein [Anaerophaga thermohalophila]